MAKMDRIYFTVNGEPHSVGGEVDSDEMLVDYVRARPELRGTKYMCREGGCGACVVAVTAPHPLTKLRRTFSVNACLTSINQCQDWEVTTIEGIGNRHKGYHPIQRTLAEYNGTQCGYCSVGWVMAMYSLLESHNYNLTQTQIEDSFASNVCRCTGYRPILEAFKSFAKDAPAPQNIQDIEDLEPCKDKSENCIATCRSKSDWCFINHEDIEEKKVKRIVLKDSKVWYRVNELNDIFDVLNAEGYDSYMLVGGNTGRGAYHLFEFPRVLIDVTAIQELKEYYLDQNLVVGGGTTLTDLMSLFRTLATEREEFGYLQKLYDHLNLVAHIPVRNVGTIAGNLMVKHRVLTFASDVFLLFEAIRAMLKIVDQYGSIVEVTPENFLKLNMTGKVITKVMIPPLTPLYYRFVSFKTMPRSQNVHAQVNAAYLYKFSHDGHTVRSARIVYGGLSAQFNHARNTELYLKGKDLFTNETLQGALRVLQHELIVEEIAGEMGPEFRGKLALGQFYKANLTLIPKHLLNPRFESGAEDLRKTRALSQAKDVYDTNPLIWPLTEPIPKVEALIQCSGEAKYVNDIPKQPGEVYAAFVTADIGKGEILDMDPAPALVRKLPGVLTFLSSKDIPGVNSFMPTNVPSIIAPEELLCSGSVQYYDQAIGIIVAETEAIANRAAMLVQVTYKAKEPPVLTINEARKDPNRVSLYRTIAATDRGADVTKVIRNSTSIFSQYFYTIESISTVTVPGEEGVDVFPSTQWLDATHVAVSQVLKLNQNRIDMVVTRTGGGFGSRVTRSIQATAACALVTYLLNRPCRIVLSIQANMRIVGKRFPCTRDFEVGINKEGEIQYLNNWLYEDNGYVVSEVLFSLTGPAIRNCYDSRRWTSEIYNVVTDTASNSWCRSPGTFEAVTMTEYLMEQISYEIAKDPLEVRLMNLKNDDAAVIEIVNTLVRDGDYHSRRLEVERFNKENRWKKRGLRIALMNWSKPAFDDYQVLLSVYHGDATVVIKHGATETGQGINTKIIQVVAFTLGIPMEKVKTKAIDVISNPNTISTAGSSATEAVTFGAVKCCQLLLDRLSTLREELGNPSWESLIAAAFLRGINLQISYHATANESNPYRVAGGALAEVELDILTGETVVRRVDIVQDAGASLNPELDLGQVEGAFIMGMGYWTSEHLIFDSKTGELLTDRTWYYQVPLAKDIPIDFRVQLRRNSYNPLGTLGAKSISECPICLAICVGFATREAITFSREETGYPRTRWFNVDGPYTLEQNVLKADVHLEEFVYYQ